MYQFNSACRKAEICSEIQANIGCSAWSDHKAAVCGDGTLDERGGEQCECAQGLTVCACCNNCQLTAGAQCYTGECCDTSTCRLAGVSTRCDGGAKLCNNGACVDASCKRYGMSYCGPNPANPCKVMCNLNGQTSCSTLDRHVVYCHAIDTTATHR